VTHLTGPPRLNGILLPRPSLGAAMDLSWSPAERVVKTYRSGVRRTLEERWRGKIRFGWEYLDPDWAQVILAEIMAAPTVELVPRIKVPGDAAWASETVLDMMVTSELPSLRQLLTGTVGLVLEMETAATYARIPGVVATGGYTVTDVEETLGGGIITLDPDGTATAEAGPSWSFTFLGETFTIPTVRLGTDEIADVHLITRTRP